MHNWKFAPIFQKAMQAIASGRIGSVWHVEIFTLRDNVCKGRRRAPAAKAEDWRTSREVAGGGILVDHGWHSFYLLLNLVNAVGSRRRFWPRCIPIPKTRTRWKMPSRR